MARHQVREIPDGISHLKFLSNVAVNSRSECWQWLGYVCKIHGYGFMCFSGKMYRAHRISYSIFGKERLSTDGEIVIDHICRNRLCVNPDHLRQVTQLTNALENTESSALKRKLQTHCKRGHEYSPENTIVSGVGVNGGVWRKCRACTTEKNKERWKKLKNSRATK